ncbi:PAS domain-containing protein [Pedobacter aquatilis]|uniref:PAS domain-containing protein n=1 Tax=Pedobacter aquatilis TaxID=351343 RepID=UPI0025B3C904|nr:PAS domain-containing protein [Pedobacter aquatilis]MDN3586005.1 PAS domain-containing protein [Pedobacter aquatilis]
MQNFPEICGLMEASSFYYIISIDMNGRYAYTNANYAKHFAKVSPGLVGQPYYITMHPDDTSTCEQVAAQCFQHPDKLFPATIRKHDGLGGFIFTQWEFRAIFDEKGQPSGIFCVGYDISELMIQRDQSKRISEEINAQSTLLEEIVFTQSHTVRAPLANLIALTRILKKNLHNHQYSGQLADMILASAARLDEIITDIVSSVRAQTDKTE